MSQEHNAATHFTDEQFAEAWEEFEADLNDLDENRERSPLEDLEEIADNAELSRAEELALLHTKQAETFERTGLTEKAIARIHQIEDHEEKQLFFADGGEPYHVFAYRNLFSDDRGNVQSGLRFVSMEKVETPTGTHRLIPRQIDVPVLETPSNELVAEPIPCEPFEPEDAQVLESAIRELEFEFHEELTLDLTRVHESSSS